MKSYIKRGALMVLGWVVALASLTATSASAAPAFTEYSVDSQPVSMASAPDGSVWSAHIYGKLTRFDATGATTTYTIPSPSSMYRLSPLQGIAVAQDGMVWVTHGFQNYISRLDPATSQVTSYELPWLNNTPSVYNARAPQFIIEGHDGAMWFTEANNTAVGRITTDGIVTEYPIAADGQALEIIAGPDGAMWFTQAGRPIVGRITMNGEITEYNLPTTDSQALHLTIGADGALWFTQNAAWWAERFFTGYGRITTDGVVTEYSIPDDGVFWTLGDIVTGADGAFWTLRGEKLARITASGEYAEYDLPSTNAGAGALVAAGDSVWFTEGYKNKIARAVVSTAPAAPANLTAISPTKQPALSWSAVAGASSYKVYRNGSYIATNSSTSYTDTTATDGTASYYVTAVNGGGESVPSNTINVVVDNVRPVMAFTAPASFSGSFTTGPMVSVTASDSGSGLRVLVIHVYTSTNQLLATCGTATPAQLDAGAMNCDLSSLPNGTYYIKAGTFDNAGNNKTINSGSFVINH